MAGRLIVRLESDNNQIDWREASPPFHTVMSTELNIRRGSYRNEEDIFGGRLLQSRLNKCANVACLLVTGVNVGEQGDFFELLRKGVDTTI